MAGEQLDLLRRTRLSVACELVRASVAHSRHLIELYTDACARTPAQGENIQLNANGATSAAAESARLPGIDEKRNILEDNIFVAALDSARWGASTEGISDSGSGHGSKGKNADDFLVRLKNLAETAAGSKVVSPDLGIHQACLGLVAQVAKDTVILCRKGTPLLLQAFAAITNAKNGKAALKHELAGIMFNARGTGAIPKGNFTPRQDPSCRGAELQPTVNPAWVFTGVVETLVLAGAFSATTVVGSGTERGINHIASRGCDSHNKREERLSVEDQTKTTTISVEEESESFGAASIVAQQIDLLHQNISSKLVRSSKSLRGHERDSLMHSGPDEVMHSLKQAVELHTDFIACGEEKELRCRDRMASEPCQFAIPFSSGFMPIIILRVLNPNVDQAFVIPRTSGYTPEDRIGARDKMGIVKNQATALKVGSNF